MRRHVVAAARRDQVFSMLDRAHDALVGGDLRGVEIELEAALAALSLIASNVAPAKEEVDDAVSR